MVDYAVGGGVFDGAGNPVVGLLAKQCTNNSTDTLLGAGEAFTGTAGDLNGYASILVTVFADVASATDGLSMQFSHSDPAVSADWHESDAFTIDAGAYKTFTFQPVDRWFRIVYTNGAAPQGNFHLNVQLHSVAPKPSSHRLADDLSTQDDATLVKAVLAAEKPNGIVTNIDSTAGGNLKVSVEEFDPSAGQVPPEVAIPKGLITGYSGVNKFGKTVNVDSGVATDIWDGANDAPGAASPIWVPPTQARIHAITSTNDNDGKTGAPSSTGARTIRVYGLTDWDTAESSEDITLDGTTPVNTVNSYVIIHRMKVLTSGASGPNLGVIKATAATDGTVTAEIVVGDGQTQMAIYGIPSTQTAYVTNFYASCERSSPTGVHVDIKLLWVFDVENQPTVRQVKHTLGLDQEGSTYVRHEYNPYNGFAGPGIFILQASASANDASVDGGFDLILVTN